MANLRLKRIKVVDSRTIRAQFTHNLSLDVNISNVNITSNVDGVPNPIVLKVNIKRDIINISTTPLVPNAIYFVEFKSTEFNKFKSRDGQAFVLEDGKTNISLVTGPEPPENEIKNILSSYLKDNVYNIDENTIVNSILNVQSKFLSKAENDIGQLKNDNYLEVIVENERKTRAKGPYDRLNEEGAFEVIKVSKSNNGTSSFTSFSFDSFPDYPVTLLKTEVLNEKLVAGTGDGTFNGLILTVKKTPVTILNEVTINYQDGYSITYNIEQFGYQINDPGYDPNFASTLLTLQKNQFKLSDQILEDDSFILPGAGDEILISYEHKSLGRFIDIDTVSVSQTLKAIREIAIPLSTMFSLENAPVVTESDNLATSGGIEFLDPNSNPPFSKTHPAFKNEIPFRLEGLPSSPGQYSIDYSTGKVFVYGAVENDGSGEFPPVMNYTYRKTFVPDLDYTFNIETFDLVANPLRELIEKSIKISFNFENVLIPNVDFKANTHIEVLDERIKNNLKSLNSLKVINKPITNAFRVFNETTGEIYTINRFSDNTIFFSFNNPPRIKSALNEKVEFKEVSSEVLILNRELTNLSGVRIFEFILSNNKIISASEDSIGSSFNSSVSFSKTDIFERELYFDAQTSTLSTNIDRLSPKEYQIDYREGKVYVAVSNDQNLDVGTINYKKSVIKPQNPHITSVSNIFYNLSLIKGVSKSVNYVSFADDEIIPEGFEISDERFRNEDITMPYIVDGGIITVTDNIKNVRHIFDLEDLITNDAPTDFSGGYSATSNKITLNSLGVEKKEILEINPDNSTIDVSFISSGSEIVGVTSIIRTSDNVQLWDSTGSFSGHTIILPSSGSPSAGEEVIAIYRVQLNGSATPIIDYSRGDYLINYTYLADEILVSYEYGDNVIDFTESSSINEGEEYFVTYKVGALRDSLLKNFGTLVDLPILNTFDTSLSREIYRDALQGALQSFTKGPTLPALKLLTSNITKIDPEITESIFESWSLGNSYLHPNQIQTNGELSLVEGKFDNGVLVKNSDETITFPVSSNIRLEEGSLGLWIIPEWSGIDNDATLTFSSITLDGYQLDSSKIFIGAGSLNPTFDLFNKFSINRLDEENSPIGLPSAIFTKTGLFIYYDDDEKRWKMLVKESTNNPDGYVFEGEIFSSGGVYDVKYIQDLGEVNDILRSSTNKIEFKLNIDGYESPVDGYDFGDGYIANHSFDGITFMADDKHYLFDFGQTENINRFSLYKDGSGFLNFEIWDNGNKITNRKNSFKVSADISSWNAGQKHFVSTSWKLNSKDKRDEIHLFIDGVEVPNIIEYGGKPAVSSGVKFRSVKTEVLTSTVTKKAILGNDLNTTAGSNIVSSDSINFQSEGIINGDTFDILELGFPTVTIINVNGNTLTLSSPVSATFDDARFSVNKFSSIVESNIDLSSNIAVYVIRGGEEVELPGLRADSPSYELSKNSSNENVITIFGNLEIGDEIAIRILGRNFRRCKERVFVWGNTSSILKTQLPLPINLDEVKITPVLLPLVTIGPDNSTLSSGNFVSDPLTAYQPSNDTEGRILSVRMTGGNVDFGTPATVTINGTTAGGPTSEIISFTATATKQTIEKWETITSVVVEVTPLVTTRNSVSVEIKEAFSITEPNGNTIFPLIRYSFKTQNGTKLQGDGGHVVSDEDAIFSDSDIGNVLVISSPGSVLGTYTITGRLDENTITVSPDLPLSFSDGIYDIYNISIGRSGFQNGFFTFETAGQLDDPFELKEGYYEFDYLTYLEIKFDPIKEMNAYVGSDINGNNQAKAVIDEFRILSRMLTDTRIGETIGINEKSFTKDFIALREFEPDNSTLMMLRFNSKPFTNVAPFYVSATKDFVQSGESINDNFGQSLVITNSPIVVNNKGIFDVSNKGTIEFWISPIFDTYNDPKERYYFDATGIIVEETVSLSAATVKVSNSISSIVSVRLTTDTDNTGKNFFIGGSIADDFKTINLGSALPSQQTPVKIAYILSGLSGDRVSLFKDNEGFLNFRINAGGEEFLIREPIFWTRNSWHRVKAIYNINNSNNLDEMRLFIDGEENAVILYGAGLVYGTGAVYGQGLSGLSSSKLIADINFSDPINNIYIGSDFLRANTAQARFDNFKLSNTVQPITTVAGQTKDINYSSNISTVLPVVEDAFTTLLLNFDQLIFKVDDLTIVRDEVFGIFNFTMQIIDSFGIVLDNPKVNQILENLIFALKPAQSKVHINIIR